MTIIAYLKSYCGWSRGIRAVFDKYQLEYEERDIAENLQYRAEMIAKSGQERSPSVEIDGVMLGNISGKELEDYLLSNQLVQPNDKQNSVPIDRGCSPEEHARQNRETTEQSIDFSS